MSTERIADELVGDLDAAFQRLLAATSDPDEERRALRESLACIYELREYRISTERAYFDSATTLRTGSVTEGVVWLRGRMTHDATARLEPRAQALFPGESTYPGPYLFPGENLCWRAASEVSVDSRGPRDDERRAIYERHVAGRPVLVTLDEVRTFLLGAADDPD